MAEYSTPAPQSGPDVLEQNKGIVRQMLEAFNTGNTDLVGKLLHPNVVDLMPSHVEVQMRNLPTIERVQAEILHDEIAFPDRQFVEDALIAEGDVVVLRWTMTGTHKGPLFGREPTGRRIKTYGYEWVRVRDGMIVEHRDDGGTTLIDVLRQLGWLDLLPPVNT